MDANPAATLTAGGAVQGAEKWRSFIADCILSSNSLRYILIIPLHIQSRLLEIVLLFQENESALANSNSSGTLVLMGIWPLLDFNIKDVLTVFSANRPKAAADRVVGRLRMIPMLLGALNALQRGLQQRRAVHQNTLASSSSGNFAIGDALDSIRRYVEQLTTALEELSLNWFPLDSYGVAVDSAEGKDIRAVLAVYSVALRKSGCLLLLRPLLPSLCEGQRHRCAALRGLARCVAREGIVVLAQPASDFGVCRLNHALSSCILELLDEFQELEVKRALMEAVALPLLAQCRIEQLTKIVCSIDRSAACLRAVGQGHSSFLSRDMFSRTMINFAHLSSRARFEYMEMLCNCTSTVRGKQVGTFQFDEVSIPEFLKAHLPALLSDLSSGVDSNVSGDLEPTAEQRDDEYEGTSNNGGGANASGSAGAEQ